MKKLSRISGLLILALGTAVISYLFFVNVWLTFATFSGVFVCFHLYERQAERQKREAEERHKLYCQKACEAADAIRSRLADGELRYLVEWWEEDDLYIDANSHLLFIYTDGTSQDFTLYEPIKEKLVSLLADGGIPWEPGFSLHFDSVIIYPSDLRGQQFYTPAGDIRNEFVR